MDWKRTLLLVVLWLAFAGMWYRVYLITPAPDVAKAATYLSLFLGTYIIVVTGWVVRNIAIYHSKGPRMSVRLLDFVATQDALRSYIVSETDLKKSQSITVDVTNGCKLFQNGERSG